MTDVRMKGFQSRTRLADVERLLDERIAALPSERALFQSAIGRVLAEPVSCPGDLPLAAKSIMDGYAVRSADLPGRFSVIGELMAADATSLAVGERQAVRIMTGAELPAGADTVVMVEETRRDGEEVVVERAFAPGTHVLPVAGDYARGSRVLDAGRRLRPQDVALLASIGAVEVMVHRRPRIRIIPTGNELVPVGTPPDRSHGSRVVESNSFMLAALAARDGAEVSLSPIVADKPELLRRALSEPGIDLIVMTGGSSVGMEDLGPVIVRELGELAVHGVHVKPASPTGIGFVRGVPVVLAPGFPVASYVAWDLFARIIVQRLSGLSGRDVRLPYRTVTARLAKDYKKPPARVEVARVLIEAAGEGELPTARLVSGGAVMLSTLTTADGFILMPEGAAEFAAGSTHTVHVY